MKTKFLKMLLCLILPFALSGCPYTPTGKFENISSHPVRLEFFNLLTTPAGETYEKGAEHIVQPGETLSVVLGVVRIDAYNHLNRKIGNFDLKTSQELELYWHEYVVDDKIYFKISDSGIAIIKPNKE